MKNLKIETYISLLFCVIIMPLILMLAPLEQWLKNNTVFLMALVIFLYALYFFYKWLQIPKLFLQHRYVRIVLASVFVVALTVLFTHFPFEYGADVRVETIAYRQYFRRRIIWFFFLIVTSYSLSTELTIALFRQAMAKKEAENEKRTAELALYKAQINPHFLFNTLNSLYSMVITKSDQTESVLIQFSNILKYMYSQAEKDLIPLGKEVEYLRQYVDLQSLRLNGHTQVKMEVEVRDEEVQVPSMLLITFIENAFKYGTSSKTDGVIRIGLHEREGKLVFETENAIMRTRQDGTGIGIANCRRRLDVLYGKRYALECGPSEDGLYRVRLELDLNLNQ